MDGNEARASQPQCSAHERVGDRRARNAALRGATLAEARAAWHTPPRDARPMVRWWWFGPAVTEAMIDADLSSMAAAGLGGAEVSVVYPMSLPNHPGGEPAPGPYLSQRFLDHLSHAAERAYELGLRFDITLGGGWSYGGPHIDRRLGAKRLRWELVELAPTDADLLVPSASPGESLVAAYDASGTQETLPECWNLLPDAKPGQWLGLAPDPGPRVVALAWCTPTGQTVKRAPVGGEGYVLDHYSAQATQCHLQAVASPLLAAAQRGGPGRVTAVFCDSLEVNRADWTPDLPQQFRRRRGYDLLVELPALLRASHHSWAQGEDVRRLRADLGRTLTELYEDNFVAPLRDFAHAHDVLLRMQGYGMPPAAMRSYRDVDLIEGESWGWDGFPPTRWAASAAHALGENVVSAEAWTWVASPSLSATPLDLQAEAIEHLSLGVTHLIGHGWPASPASVPDPGWVFYAAGDLSDRNPWWPAMPALTTYLARLGAVARLGDPVRSVGIYVPEATAYGHLTPGGDGLGAHVNLWAATGQVLGDQLIGALRRAGYDVCVLDDSALRTAQERHRVIVIAVEPQPDVPDIPDSLGHPGHPEQELIPDHHNHPANAEFARLREAGVTIVPPGPVSDQVRAVSAALEGALPDLSPGVLTVHRRIVDADLILLLNVTSADVATRVRPTLQRASWELWEPRRGTAAKLTSEVVVPAHGALVVVGHDGEASDFGPAQEAARAAAPPAPVSVDWRLPDGSAASFPALADWREGPGGIVLSTEVNVGPEPGVLTIDLGEGGATDLIAAPDRGTGPSYRARYLPPAGTAVVLEVDGQAVGALWSPPYRLSIPLGAGGHRLRLSALGTAVGSIAGSEDLAALQERLTAHYGQRFAFQDLRRSPEPVTVGFRQLPRVGFTRGR